MSNVQNSFHGNCFRTAWGRIGLAMVATAIQLIVCRYNSKSIMPMPRTERTCRGERSRGGQFAQELLAQELRTLGLLQEWIVQQLKCGRP